MAELAAKPRSQVRQGLYRLFEAAPGVIMSRTSPSALTASGSMGRWRSPRTI